MSEAKWVDLSRYGARLEIVDNPTLLKRQLRFLVYDIYQFQNNVFDKPMSEIKGEERSGRIQEYYDGLSRYGFVRDDEESAELRKNESYRSPNVYYSDNIAVSHAMLTALIPSLRLSDYVSASVVSPKGLPFEWSSSAEIIEKIAQEEASGFIFDSDGDVISLGPDFVPTYYLPAGKIERSQIEPGADRSFFHTPVGAKAFSNADVAVVEVWTNRQDCARHLGVDDGAVREIRLPHSCIVGASPLSRTLLVVPDARFVRADLEQAYRGVSGLSERIALRNDLKGLASTASMIKNTIGLYDDDVFLTGAKEVIDRVDQFIQRLDPEFFAENQFQWSIRSDSFHALLHGVKLIDDEQWTAQCMLDIKAISQKAVAIQADIGREVTEQDAGKVYNKAMRQERFVALVRAFGDQHVSRDLMADAIATELMANEPVPNLIGVFEEDPSTPFYGMTTRLKEELKDQPRCTWALVRKQPQDGDAVWVAAIADGSGKLMAGEHDAIRQAVQPTFEQVYRESVYNEISSIARIVSSERRNEENINALSILLDQGLEAGYQVQNFDVDYFLEFSKATVTGFDAAKGLISLSGTRKKGRRTEKVVAEVAATALAAHLGISSEEKPLWSIKREDYFKNLARVRRDVLGFQKNNSVLVSYAYDIPSLSGPFAGKMYASRDVHLKGESISTPFGKATVTEIDSSPEAVDVSTLQLYELGKDFHKRVVSDAMERGEAVPQDVLSDYPELGLAFSGEANTLVGKDVTFTPLPQFYPLKYDAVISGKVVAVDATSGGSHRLRIEQSKTGQDGLPTEKIVYWPSEGIVSLQTAHVADASASVSSQSAQEEDAAKIRHEDVGEKIGGARKDFYANRLKVSDLDAMNDIEKTQLVTKDNIWPKLNYPAMREAGVAPDAAYAIKWLKDKIAVRCQNSQHARAYITAVDLIRDEMETVKTLNDFRDSCERIVERIKEIEPEHARYSYTVASPTHASLSYDAVRVLANPYKATSMARVRTNSGTSWDKLIRPESNTKRSTGEKERNRPSRPHLDKIERSGSEWRQGRDVTGEEMLQTFGFRGIEYGNWLPQDERQTVLNHAYDAFMDMANVLGVPPKAMSLDGTMAIAFGARGKGRAMAHFEPSRMVINLTRLSGAGSLAHEFGHALDRWMAMKDASVKTMFLSESCAQLPSEANEMSKAFAKVMDGIMSRPMSIEEGIEAATKKFKTERENARTNVNGFSTYLNYTGFSRDDPHNEGYVNSVKVLIGSAFKIIDDEALSSRNSLEMKKEYDDFLLDEKIDRLYRINGGKKRSFLSGKDSSSRAYWANTASFGLIQLHHLQNLKEKGWEYTPLVAHNPGELESARFRKTDTDFMRSAEQLDAQRSSKYYTKPLEMFARAFESYVFDAIEKRAQKSEYLVHGVEGSRYSEGYTGNPYPSGSERDEFYSMMQKASTALEQHFENEKNQININSL